MTTFTGQQGFPQQGQAMSNISLREVGTAQTRRQLTSEIIMRHQAAAAKKGLGEYWQVKNPSRALKLTGARNYVERRPEYANAQGVKQFVYWPDYRVAG